MIESFQGQLSRWVLVAKSISSGRYGVSWFSILSYFVAGAFFANGIPHLTQGIAGKKFPTPFGKPPGVGLSSPVINVIWGILNFMLSIILVRLPGGFIPGWNFESLFFFLGALLLSVYLALHFSHPG